MRHSIMVRRYGTAPYTVALIHGGPGAVGEMIPVALELQSTFGVMEHLQQACSVDELIEELAGAIHSCGGGPMVFVGHSWGAWLGFMTTGRYPELVKKLIMVGSAPFKKSYATAIDEVRFSRLSLNQRTQLRILLQAVNTSDETSNRSNFSQLSELINRADTYSPRIDMDQYEIDFQPELFRLVWKEASALRLDGTLLSFGENIQCEVVALHGDYDPHPIRGVVEPLSRMLPRFRCIEFSKCGHTPWLERFAYERFFTVLRREIESA
ncbi:MAG: alpha/beta hydrolase [Chitinivibrionales bacterium]|nr:alpha/beta hydrolase [Chitinivibrionales bacterium]